MHLRVCTDNIQRPDKGARAYLSAIKWRSMLAPSTYPTHHTLNLYFTIHLLSSPDALAYLVSRQELKLGCTESR